MPQSKGNGGKNRRRGKNIDENTKELVKKEEGQEYALVLKMLGNGRIDAKCYDGKSRLAHIRGKMRKKVWINVGDTILVGLREFEDGKCDVIHKYQGDEVRKLVADGQIPKNEDFAAGKTDDAAVQDNDDCAFDFESI